jgi:hypothetical protein
MLGEGLHVIPLESRRVQFRETIRADGTVREERLVFCDRTERWELLARCRTCDACAHLSGDAEPILICSVAPTESSRRRDSVRSQLARRVWCIEADAAGRLACIMPTSQADAIVVDRDGHAIGLLPRLTARRAERDALARSMMQPGVVALFDEAPLERAQELRWKRGVRTLPLLSAGRVVGCIECDYRDRGA